MTQQTAQCQCGQLSITVSGKPKFVNACACRKCQKESGGPIHVGVFFDEAGIVSRHGVAKTYKRATDKGNTAVKYFCPECGAKVYWYTGAVPGCVGVSWGALENPEALMPNWCVWTQSLPSWVDLKEMKQFETQPD